MTATPVSGGKEGLAASHPDKQAPNHAPPGKESKPFQALLESLKKPVPPGDKKKALTPEEFKAALAKLAGKAKAPASKLDLAKQMAEQKASVKKKLIEALKALAKSDGKTPVKKKLKAKPEANATPVVLLVAVQPQLAPHKDKPQTAALGAEKKPAAAQLDPKHPGTKPLNGASLLQPQGIAAHRVVPVGPVGEKKSETPATKDKKLTVVDLRSPEHKTQGKLPLDAQPPTSPGNLELKPKAPEAKPDQSFQAVFQTVTGGTSSSFAAQAPAAPVPAQDLAALHRFLNGEGPGRMADQARFILRDNDRGEIHLTLYPETLGKVKIALNLNGQHLDGRIFVENQNVKDVFQQNLNGLMQAFKDSGWNELTLQVSVGGGDGSSGDRSGSQDSANGYRRSVKSETLDSIPVPGRIVGWSDRLVNLQA
jgi:flagellar hook-length control protein FliK